MLTQLGIKQHKSKPRNPEENGKIERFWQNIEALSNYNDIPALILIYNYSMTQKILKSYTGRKCTPEQVFTHLSHFDWYNDYGKKIEELLELTQ